VENLLLRRVYAALGTGDNAAVDETRDNCLDLVWPLMLGDYAERIKSGETPRGICSSSVEGTLRFQTVGQSMIERYKREDAS
jgi:hypothetical protein